MRKNKKKTVEPRVQASVWLPVALVKRLKMAAIQRETTSTAVVTEALETFLSSRSAA